MNQLKNIEREHIDLQSEGKVFIVVIEDDYDDVELLCESIKEANVKANVECFKSAKKAFEYLNELDEQTNPSLFILDYNLPITNGYQILLELNTIPRFRQVVKIIYTNSSNPREKDSCLSSGATAFIQKRFTVTEINEDVKTMLSYINLYN